MTNTTLMYQHGTLAALVPGLFTGTQTLGDLLQHGDTGIGTLTGLDGELIILDSKVYQVNAQGQVNEVGPEAEVPFANVHYAAFTPKGTLAHLDFTGVQDAVIAAMGTVNLFVGVKMHGTFAKMQTRAVAKQEEPYPTLTATASAQSVFDHTNVEGTVIGYFSPKLYAGMVSPGFHLHFLSDDHQSGGHILNMAVGQAALSLQVFADIQLHLPSDNGAFLATSFDSDQIVRDIRKAEN